MDDTRLINAALVLLGEPFQASGAAPRGRVGQAAAELAPQVRQQLLSKQRWTASLTAGRVVPDEAATPFHGYRFVGALPEDLVRLWDCAADAFSLCAGRKLAWSGAAAVQIVYARDASFEECDPLLQHALAARLAYQLVATPDGSDGRAQRYRSMAIDAEVAAASSDALNRREAPLLTSNWLYGGHEPPRGRFEPL